MSVPQLQNKLQEARNTLHADIDPVTGKRLFHPETGRAPTGVRRAGDTPVGEYLYNLKQQQDEKARAALDEKERKQRETAARAKQSKGSRELVKTLQNKRFKQVGGQAASNFSFAVLCVGSACHISQAFCCHLHWHRCFMHSRLTYYWTA